MDKDFEGILNAMEYATNSPEAKGFEDKVAAAQRRINSPVYKAQQFIGEHKLQTAVAVTAAALFVYSFWPR